MSECVWYTLCTLCVFVCEKAGVERVIDSLSQVPLSKVRLLLIKTTKRAKVTLSLTDIYSL